jgi:hypothetical protein
VHAILEGERNRAAQILEARRPVLEEIARRLIAEETLDRATLEAIVQPQPEGERRRLTISDRRLRGDRSCETGAESVGDATRCT